MKSFRHPGLWLGVWLALLLAVVVLSLAPPPPTPDVPQGDKWQHLLTYAGLALVAVQIFRPGRALALAAAATVLLGIGLEVAQGTLTTDRMMDWRDALANTAGVALGTASVLLPVRDVLLRWDAVDRASAGGPR
ncbi:VanZ family protein [Nocardioides humi]|uniref:Membrane protein n=1 Tax=Nocardioides humi TaxID=449461 RepID=A0ABN2AIQ4_9ACTN|nr:VanZ family protein [Nocardioides humi]